MQQYILNSEDSFREIGIYKAFSILSFIGYYRASRTNQNINLGVKK